MKITAFISNLSKGGAQGVFVTVINHLVNKGYEVEVVVQNLIDDIHSNKIANKIKISSLDVKSAKELFIPLKRYVKENKVEFALVFSPEMSVNLFLVKQFLHARFPICARCMNTLSVEYSHASSFFRKYITNSFLKFFYCKVDKVIAQSAGMGMDLVQNYGFDPEQVVIINNALGKSFEEELDQKAEEAKEDVILYAGRLEEQKGLVMLLQAFSKMKNKNVKLELVGSGGQRGALEQLAAELNVKTRVRFVEHVSNIVAYYKKAKVTVLSSYYEGFPNVLVESLACGTPVVSFDLPSGPSEIIIENVNGFLVEHLNIQKLATALDCAVEREWNIEDIKETAEKYRRNIIMKEYIKVIESVKSGIV